MNTATIEALRRSVAQESLLHFIRLMREDYIANRRGNVARKPKSILAWHWLRDDGTMRDGRKKPNRVERHKGPMTICKSGLHASVRLIDALVYAPGAVLCRVRCTGIGEQHHDKFVCRTREILWQVDATKTLHEFACRCAERALKRAMVTDERCWSAIKVKRLWLRGKATDAELADAEAAARAAARAAAWAAARDAALATARDAARAAAWAAARDAALATAWDAALAAAWNSERTWQNKLLVSMVNKLRSSRGKKK